jgi:serine/threonine-protein kinase
MSEAPILNHRYQLEDRLGSGGMAMVYRARDLMLERVVAVKVLRHEFSSDPAFCERFQQEAKAAANLSHPNIVTVHDFGFDDERLFIVMEYVPGTPLKNLLQNRGRFTVEEAIPLMVQACAGVGYAHRAGLVHCDIKPQNMLVTPDQRLKVVDFGIARALTSISPTEKSDVVWGSPQYFAPEQAAGGAPSPASDVYSLGVILYEMLTGRLPFIAETPTELARMHRQAFPKPPRLINPAIPPALDQIILKVLSKEPAARYRTADQLGRVLMSYGKTTVLPAAEPSAPMASPSSRPVKLEPLRRPRPSTVASQPIPVTPRPTPTGPVPTGPVVLEEERENPLDIDWITWGLFLLAIVAVLGLIPVWVWVYLSYYPPAS